MHTTVISCIYYLHQVNRVNPSGDVERGRGLNDKGLAGREASLSSSVNSVGLVNFGRTPVQVYPLYSICAYLVVGYAYVVGYEQSFKRC